jgi:hypothetical protein
MGSIELRVARVVDLEALAEVLSEHGIEAEALEGVEPVDGEEPLGFTIPCEDGDRAELLAQVELLIADTGLPLVPVQADGFVFLRPPGD